MNDIHANSYNSQVAPPPPPPPPVAMQPGMPSPYMPYYQPPQRGGSDWNDRGRYNDNNISDPRLRSRDPRMQANPPPR